MPMLQLISKSSLGLAATSIVDPSMYRLKTQQKPGLLSLKNSTPAFATSCTFRKGCYVCSLQLETNRPSSKISHFPLMEEVSVQHFNASREKSQVYILHDLDESPQIDGFGDTILARKTASVSGKELERRRRIGLANRGRIPWNKGIKHSEETRMRIKKQTIIALNDPKVRKKMSEWPHSHSDQSKAKISLALRKIWLEFSKHKRLQEKLHCSWARYIAEAAKLGDEDQWEHDWDSFSKVKAELNSQYLQEREERAKARETVKLSAEKVARDREEKLAQKTKMKREKAKTIALPPQHLLNRKNMRTLARESKLRKRLAKYCKKMEIPARSPGESSAEPQLFVEKLDLELIKTENSKKCLTC